MQLRVTSENGLGRRHRLPTQGFHTADYDTETTQTGDVGVLPQTSQSGKV